MSSTDMSTTAIQVISKLSQQIDEALGTLQQQSSTGSGSMALQHPQGFDKRDHFAVFERQGNDTLRLVGQYPANYAMEAIEQASSKSSDRSKLVCVPTHSLWAPSI